MPSRGANVLTLGLMAIALTGIPLPRPAAAGGAGLTHCQRVTEIPRPTLPLDARRFADIGPEDVTVAEPGATLTEQALDLRFEERSDERGLFNEIEGGAIVLVQTDRNWRAKLVAVVERSFVGDEAARLRILRIVIYDPQGRPNDVRTDRVLAPGEVFTIEKRDEDTPAPPGGDAGLRWTSTDSGGRLDPLGGARLRALTPIIAVPTVARFMRSVDHPDNDIERRVSKKTVQHILDLVDPVGSVNRIWKPAGILFFLAALERCTYSMYSFLADPPAIAREHLPWPINDCQQVFRRINAAYNSPGALNLYVWFHIGLPIEGLGSTILAFAAPDRRDGPSTGPGAVWMDGDCVGSSPNSPRTCDRVLGHEIGHFLRLRHTCMLGAEQAAQRCRFPMTVVPDCPGVPGTQDLLMRGDFAMSDLAQGGLHTNLPPGERLTPREIAEARQAASERLRP